MRDKSDVGKLWKLLCKNDPKTRGAAKEALVSIGAPAVPTLIRAMAKPDRRFSDGTSLHSKAYRVLYLIGERAVEPLRELARTGAVDVRRVANERLAKLVPSRTGAAERLVNATGPSLEEAARALADTGGDEAVNLIVARLRRVLSFADRFVLVRSLASLAASGSVKARSSMDWALGTLKHSMTMKLAAFYEQRITPGTIDPRLREEINRLGELLQAGIRVSSTASISDSSPMVLEDGSRRFRLKRGEAVEVQTGLSDEVVVVGHEFWVLPADDDPYLASIHKMLSEGQSQAGPDTSVEDPGGRE